MIYNDTKNVSFTCLLWNTLCKTEFLGTDLRDERNGHRLLNIPGRLIQGPRVFHRPFTHGGGICPPYGGQVQGNKALMEGGRRPYGGDLTLIDYITN